MIFISATTFGQTDDTDKYIWYKFQYGSRMARFWADSVLKAGGLVKFTGLATASADTTTYKPTAVDASGNVVKMGSWPGGGGTLQQVMTLGNTTDNVYVFDSSATAEDGSPVTGYVWKYLPLDRTGDPPYFSFGLAATKYVGVTRRDNVFCMGWNLSAGGGPLVSGEPFCGLSGEHTYISAVGDTIGVEWHTFLGDYLGRQIRGESYTGRKNTDGTLNIDHYHAVARSYLKHPYTDRVYFSTQPSAAGASSNWSLSESKGFSIIYDSITGVVADIVGTVSSGSKGFVLQNFNFFRAPTMTIGNEVIVDDGANLRSTSNNTTQLGDASRRWSTMWGVNGNYSGTLTATTGRFGGGGIDFGLSSLAVSKHNNDGTIFVVENNNSGNAAYTQMMLNENISAGHYSDWIRYNNNSAGSWGGTSIPLASLVGITNSFGNSLGSKPLLFGAGQIIAAPGNTGTNYGNRQDATGFRIGQLSTLHNANTLSFSIDATDAMKVPSGTDAQRPTGVASYFRYNSTANIIEWHNGTTWVQPATGGGGIYGGSGSLPSDVTVTGGANGITFNSTRTGANATMNINNTSSGAALVTNASGSGTGLEAGSSTGYGGNIFSTSGPGLQVSSSSNTGLIVSSTTGTPVEIQTTPASTNTDIPLATLVRKTSGTAASGIAGHIAMHNENGSGSDVLSNKITSKLTTVTGGAEVSQLEFSGINSGVSSTKFTIFGTGQYQGNAYGSGTFSVTPATTPVYSSTGIVGERIAPKIYTALLTQSGTGDPTATVLGTNEIGTIVWTRNSAGNYTGTLTGAFTANKTWLICQKGDGSGSFVNGLLSRSGDNTLALDVRDNTATVTDNFTNMSIEIRVYP